MSKFTKGPWKIIPDRDCTPGCGSFPTVENDHGDQVISGEWYSSLTSDNEGDLCLIACAPELYDALDRLLGMHAIQSSRQRKLVEALLSKARGE